MLDNGKLEWNIRVPILRNRLIVRQLLIAVGLPFGILIAVFAAVRAYEGLLLLGILFLLSAAIIAIVFRGTYDVHYIIDARGILCENQPKQAKRVRAVSVLTVMLGLFSRNPSAAGAGLLAQGSTKILLPWKRIRRVRYYDKRGYITVFGGFAEQIAVFCSSGDYASVKKLMLTEIDKQMEAQQCSVKTAAGK